LNPVKKTKGKDFVNYFKILLLILCLPLLMTNCSKTEKKKYSDPNELLLYIGITMVKPVSELALRFEKINNCKIIILQGGSQDLYDSLKMSMKGDLYLPGSLSYRKNNLSDGILLDNRFVGYNKAALFVKKGNPKAITSNLKQITDSRYSIILCNPESGSIGRETKKILEKAGIYKEAMQNTLFLTSDSNKITQAFKEEQADLSINWYATSFWDENRNIVDAIALDDSIAEKKQLVFNLLSCSTNPELSRKFMSFSASEEGRKIFHKYGFLSNEDLNYFDQENVE